MKFLWLWLKLSSITGNLYEDPDRKVKIKALFRKIGPVVKSRFTTLETRILRAYLSETSPCHELVKMVNFIIHCWAPAFLMSKLYPYNHFAGPRILLYFVMSAKKHLNSLEIKAIESGINWNPYQLAHENIALCLLCSEDMEERKRAVEKILSLRASKVFKVKIAHGKASSEIRAFEPSTDLKVNMNATDLFNLNQTDFSLMKFEPPATQNLTLQQLIDIFDSPLQIKLPLSSTAVERAVKETSKTCKMSHDTVQRRGIIQNTILSRDGDRH